MAQARAHGESPYAAGTRGVGGRCVRQQQAGTAGRGARPRQRTTSGAQGGKMRARARARATLGLAQAVLVSPAYVLALAL
jgi:hypothetical protein